MIAAHRRNLVLEVIRADGAVSISAAAERLDASVVTVRRDLDQLASEGLVTRTHGGAVASGPSREQPYLEKLDQAAREKTAIGRLAAELVKDGDTLVIGPGTTTEALAENLRGFSGLTVVTNSLPVAELFVASPDVEVRVLDLRPTRREEGPRRGARRGPGGDRRRLGRRAGLGLGPGRPAVNRRERSSPETGRTFSVVARDPHRARQGGEGEGR